MKKTVLFLFSVMLTVVAWAQSETQPAQVNGPIITFDETLKEFGDIYQGDKVEHVFAFENTGNEPLIITNVQTTCGCTAPEWPRDPVTPGQKSSIKVIFNSAGKSGRQHKVITVQSNAVSPNNQVTITTNVLPKKEGGS